MKRAKLPAHDWSSGRLGTAHSIEKLFFCNKGVSFRDLRGIYRRIKGQERKWKHEEQHGVVKERFQKVGKWKKLASKFRRVRERCPWPTIVAFSVKVIPWFCIAQPFLRITWAPFYVSSHSPQRQFSILRVISESMTTFHGSLWGNKPGKPRFFSQLYAKNSVINNIFEEEKKFDSRT